MTGIITQAKLGSRAAKTRKAELERQNKTAMTELPGQDCQDSQDRAASTGMPGKDYASTGGLLG